MEIPIIKYSDKSLKNINPFINLKGITIFPFIILKEKYKGDESLINHETIHIEQQKELLIILFYPLYFLEWLIKVFKYGYGAYKNLSFEREANFFEDDLPYLKNRKRYAFIKYIFKSPK